MIVCSWNLRIGKTYRWSSSSVRPLTAWGMGLHQVLELDKGLVHTLDIVIKTYLRFAKSAGENCPGFCLHQPDLQYGCMRMTNHMVCGSELTAIVHVIEWGWSWCWRQPSQPGWLPKVNVEQLTWVVEFQDMLTMWRSCRSWSWQPGWDSTDWHKAFLLTLLCLQSLESFFTVNLWCFFFLFFLSEEYPDKALRLAMAVNASIVFRLLVPKFQRLSSPLCLHSQHTYNIMVQLREVNSSYVTAKIFAVMNSKNSL